MKSLLNYPPLRKASRINDTISPTFQDTMNDLFFMKSEQFSFYIF